MTNWKRLLVLNSASNIALSFLNNAVSLITLPLYLEIYGDTLWGIYTWALSISGALIGFDFGIKAGLRRYVAMYTGNKNKNDLEIALSISIALIFGMGILISFSIFVLSFFPDFLLPENSKQWKLASLILACTSIYSLFFWANLVFEAILEGHQKYIVINCNKLVSTICFIGIYLWVLHARIHFESLVVILIAANCIAPILQLISIIWLKLLSGVQLSIKLTKNHFHSGFYKFSTHLFIIALFDMLTFRIDKILIGGIVGAAFVTKYIIVTKPMFFIRGIDSYIFSAIQPFIAKEHSQKNTALLYKVIIKGSYINYLAIAPLCLVIILLLKPFINVWVGSAYDPYIIWGQLAILIFLIKPYYGIVSKYLINTGVTKPLIKIRAITSTTNLFFSIILTYFWGIGGVILGSLIQVLLNFVYYTHLLEEYTAIDIKKVLSKKIFGNVLYLSVLTLIIFYAFDFNLITGWFTLIFYTALFLIIYYAHGLYLIYQDGMFLDIFKLRNNTPIQNQISKPS